MNAVTVVIFVSGLVGAVYGKSDERVTLLVPHAGHSDHAAFLMWQEEVSSGVFEQKTESLSDVDLRLLPAQSGPGKVMRKRAQCPMDKKKGTPATKGDRFAVDWSIEMACLDERYGRVDPVLVTGSDSRVGARLRLENSPIRVETARLIDVPAGLLRLRLAPSNAASNTKLHQVVADVMAFKVELDVDERETLRFEAYSMSTGKYLWTAKPAVDDDGIASVQFENEAPKNACTKLSSQCEVATQHHFRSYYALSVADASIPVPFLEGFSAGPPDFLSFRGLASEDVAGTRGQNRPICLTASFIEK